MIRTQAYHEQQEVAATDREGRKAKVHAYRARRRKIQRAKRKAQLENVRGLPLASRS